MSRISLGLILIYDLVSRLNQVEVLYGANAMVPPFMVKGSFPFIWNLYLLNDQLWFTQALILITIFTTVCWTIGVRGKWALIATWFLYASLFYRNTLIHSGAEPTLLAALFWFLWLPHNRVWSWGNFKNQTPVVAYCLSAGSVAFILQVVIYYVFSGLHKYDPIWWQEGSALYYALNLDTFASSAGVWLLGSKTAIQLLSFAVLWLELLSPILLLLLPLLFGNTMRSLAVALLIGLHIGIAVFMDIGIFPYVNIAILLALLPITRFTQGAREVVWGDRKALTLISLLSLIACQAAYSSYRLAHEKPPKVLKTVLQISTTGNAYKFFAPKPPLRERFWFMVGTLADGREVDAHGLSVTPIEINKNFAVDKWNLFHQRYFTHWARKTKRASKLRAQFAQYLCHRWQRNSEQMELPPLASITLKYQLEQTAEWGENKADFVYTARGDKHRCTPRVN